MLPVVTVGEVPAVIVTIVPLVSPPEGTNQVNIPSVESNSLSSHALSVNRILVPESRSLRSTNENLSGSSVWYAVKAISPASNPGIPTMV